MVQCTQSRCSIATQLDRDSRFSPLPNVWSPSPYHDGTFTRLGPTNLRHRGWRYPGLFCSQFWESDLLRNLDRIPTKQANGDDIREARWNTFRPHRMGTRSAGRNQRPSPQTQSDWMDNTVNGVATVSKHLSLSVLFMFLICWHSNSVRKMVINRSEYVWERHRDTIYVRI